MKCEKVFFFFVNRDQGPPPPPAPPLVLLEAIQGEPYNYVIVTIFHMYAMLWYMIVYWLVMHSFGIGIDLY